MSPVEGRGRLRVLAGLIRSGAGSVALHPLRSAVTVASVVALVLPWTVGIGISHGLRAEVAEAARLGPDLVVTGERFGRAAPVPLAARETLRGIPGVTEVIPRIVGELTVGARGESAVVVGLPADRVPRDLRCVDGRLFAPGAEGEIVVGVDLARRLGIRPGTVLPPMYRNEAGERLSVVVGVFRSEAPLWQSHTILASLETAGRMFAEPGAATEMLVLCREGFREPVAEQVALLGDLRGGGGGPPVRPRVSTRGDVEALLLRRVLDRETLLQLPFLLAFAMGVPLVLVTSGAGLVERRREAGLLRAVGWGPDALLFRALVESALLALAGAALAVVLAWLWLEAFHGAGLAPVLLPGADRVPGFRLPWRLGPVPVLLAFAVTTAMVAAGTLHSTWRSATAPPAEAMR